MTVTVWAKNLFASKTFWANIAFLAVTLVDAIVAADLPVVNEPWWAVIITLTNVWLRKLTTQPVVVGAPKQVRVDQVQP